MKLPQWAQDIKEAGGVNAGDWTRWEPAPGDILAGEVAGYHSFEGKYGVATILIVRQDDGEEVSHLLSHKVLKQELEKWANKLRHKEGQLAVGTEVAIVYLGAQKSKEGNSFQGYQVYARDPETPF